MKVNLHIKLNASEPLDIKVKGIKKDNYYIYYENDIKVSIYYSDDNINIIRECNDYKIDLKFKKNEKSVSTYSVFGGTKVFELNTKNTKMNVKKDRIEIDYEIDDEKFKYVLEVI